MEVIRQKVATPGLMGSTIPAEVHMKCIQGGLVRLREIGFRARDEDRKGKEKSLVTL